MSDEKNTEVEEREEPAVAPSDEPRTLLNPVAAPEGALIGDENIPPAGDVNVVRHEQDVPAQVTGKPAVPVETVRETVTVVQLDEVITDPNDPRGVQVPDAGRGSLDLPFHRLTAPRPEAAEV